MTGLDPVLHIEKRDGQLGGNRSFLLALRQQGGIPNGGISPPPSTSVSGGISVIHGQGVCAGQASYKTQDSPHGRVSGPNIKVLTVKNPPLKAGLTEGGGGIWG